MLIPPTCNIIDIQFMYDIAEHNHPPLLHQQTISDMNVSIFNRINIDTYANCVHIELFYDFIRISIMMVMM